MDQNAFLRKTVFNLNSDLFEQMKSTLIRNKLLVFSFLDEGSITRDEFCEKLCDFFTEKERLRGKSFDQILEKYISDLDSVVANRIAKKPKSQKGKDIQPVVRARKHYELACDKWSKIKDPDNGLKDYSRVMFCLYTEIINNGFSEISDYDYSFEKCSIEHIINALIREKNRFVQKFDLCEVYSLDLCTFILVVIMYYNIKNPKVRSNS